MTVPHSACKVVDHIIIDNADMVLFPEEEPHVRPFGSICNLLGGDKFELWAKELHVSW